MTLNNVFIEYIHMVYKQVLYYVQLIGVAPSSIIELERCGTCLDCVSCVIDDTLVTGFLVDFSNDGL